MRPKLLLASVLVVLAPLVASCASTGSGSSGSVPANANVHVIAEDIKYDQKSYEAPAGDVVFGYTNQGQQIHTLLLKDADGKNVPNFKLTVPPGKATGGSINLPAGTYTMYCDIPGHEAAGMKATLTVK